MGSHSKGEKGLRIVVDAYQRNVKWLNAPLLPRLHITDLKCSIARAWAHAPVITEREWDFTVSVCHDDFPTGFPICLIVRTQD